MIVKDSGKIPPGFKVAEKFPVVKKQFNGIDMFAALQALIRDVQAQFPTASHLLGAKVDSKNDGFCVARGKPYKLVQ
jgi:hypothetical protein